MPAIIRSVCFLMAAAAFSCAPLKLQHTFRVNPGDWVMYGGGPERTNATPVRLAPPLEETWRYHAGAGFGPCSPAAADSLLFVGNLQGEVHAIDVRSGSALGIFDFGPAVTGTPAVDRDRLYVALSNTEESLICYNTRSGRIEWRLSIGEIESSPLLQNGRLIVTTLGGTLSTVDANTGSVLWSFIVPVPSLVRSSPACDGAHIVFGSDEGWIYSVDLATGSLIWKTRLEGPVAGSPSVLDGRVYVCTLPGNLAALDGSTGVIVWQRNLGGMIYGSQAVDGRRVYVGTTGRSLHALDAVTGDLVWSVPLQGIVSAAPIVSGDILYVGTNDRILVAVEIAGGRELWRTETGARVRSVPIVHQNRLVVLLENHEVVAYRSAEDGR